MSRLPSAAVITEHTEQRKEPQTLPFNTKDCLLSGDHREVHTRLSSSLYPGSDTQTLQLYPCSFPIDK